MKLRRKNDFTAELAVSALNDIMFFLLLFFLLISALSAPGLVKVVLPESKVKADTNTHPLHLTITEDKKFFVEEREVKFSELEAVLTSATANNADRTVVVRPSKNLTIQDLVDVIEIGARNNLKMVLATTNTKK